MNLENVMLRGHILHDSVVNSQSSSYCKPFRTFNSPLQDARYRFTTTATDTENRLVVAKGKEYDD